MSAAIVPPDRPVPDRPPLGPPPPDRPPLGSPPPVRPPLGPPPPARPPPDRSPLRPDPGLCREWLAPFHVDVRLTLSVHRRGSADPAYRVDEAGAVWRTSLTPAGPATLRVTSRHTGDAAGPPGNTLVTGYAWGPGARWLLDRLPAQLGAHDDPSGLRAGHPVLAGLALRHPGLRIGRSWRILEALVPAVLEQKVVGREAQRAWRFLLRTFGTAAPGPAPDGMRVVPSPAQWARIPSWDWHRAGVEGVRARTIIAAAELAGRLEQVLDLDTAEADRRLRSIPGIGPWTSAEVRQRAAGDPDAVSVGDYHLPRAVGWTLAGRITDDAGMLELLAPYAGHRYRVTRLIELGGSEPPRRGPRLPVRDYRAF